MVHLGVLSTKVKTLWEEEVTIPNAVVVSQTTTDYNRVERRRRRFYADLRDDRVRYAVAPGPRAHAVGGRTDRGAAARTKTGRAAGRARGFLREYTLLVCLERQQSRLFTFDALHANIQDLFNEYGVQIMSPNYVLDPSAPKVVQKENWFTAPARPGR